MTVTQFSFLVPDCEKDEDCLDKEYCELDARSLITAINTCGPPCEKWPCGPNSYCSAFGHRAHCRCVEGYTGDPTSPQGCGK